MKPSDRTYLQNVLDNFIYAGINRLSHSGNMQHRFRLDATELKQVTGRQRLHETVVHDVESFFDGSLVKATYDQERAAFDIDLNLSQCALNHQQSSALSDAMTYYHADA